MRELEDKTDCINVESETDKVYTLYYDLYKEIISAEDFAKAESIFYENINHAGMKDKASIFKAIIIRAENYEKAEEFVCYMNELGINLDIQIYDTLLKKMKDQNDMINLYNKMKNLCIRMDRKFLIKIADGMIGTDEYYQILYERDCFKQIREAARKIQTPQDVIVSIENLFSDNNVEENGYNYYLFINSLRRADTVKKCIEILYERKIKPDEKIYMAVLNKLKRDDEEYIIYLDILNDLKHQLDEDERKRLIHLLNYYSKINGGETKWLLEKDKLIEGYKKQILIENDIEKQQFLIGKIEGLSFETLNQYIYLQSQLNEMIEEAEAEEDSELYRLQISNYLGQLSAVQESEDLYYAEKKKNMPILYVVYVENREFLNEVKKAHLKDYYYELDELSDKKVNSFIMAFSADEFIKCLNEVDYDAFDVRVKIYGQGAESADFYSKSDENKRIYKYMYSNMQKKICFFTYAHAKVKTKNESAVCILNNDDIIISNKNSLLDNYYAIKYIMDLKDRIDKLDDEELISFQKLGNYYIPVLKGMLNRCIGREQRDWKFVMTLLDYENITDIERDVQDIYSMEEIMGIIRIDRGRFEKIMPIIKNYLSSLSDNGYFERIEKAKEILAEIILIKVDSSERLDKTIEQNIIEREEGRKEKTNLERIPFRKLKRKFADDEELMRMILDAQEQMSLITM